MAQKKNIITEPYIKKNTIKHEIDLDVFTKPYIIIFSLKLNIIKTISRLGVCDMMCVCVVVSMVGHKSNVD